MQPIVTYKVFIDKTGMRQIIDNDSFQPVELDDSIVPAKLFPEDVFTYDVSSNKPATIVHSIVRTMTNIPGVLVIDDFNTFGKRKGKSLYKCMPDDTRLPTFLVPYEMKHLGFSKNIPNLYVTIQFAEWEDKHPIGTLSQNIGGVDVLEHFYEYQLYCKSLNHSIQKFNKAVEKKLKESDSHALIDDAFAIIKGRAEDRATGHYVFTIDPPGCTDFDDGFSVVENGASGSTTISIYISNVPVLLESLNLWSTFSQRVSTIYLPDKKRPMLPTILSDGLCSLQAKQSRIAYVIDVKVSKMGVIESVDHLSCKIRVARNFEYEEPALFSNGSYKLLLQTVNALSSNYKYLNNVQNSHDVVAYLMILMNNYCAKQLSQLNLGLFRVTRDNQTSVAHAPNNAPSEVNKFIEIWRSVCGQYVDLSKLNARDGLTHSILNLEEYVHITSPIRRIVDLLNMIMIQCDTPFGEDARKFVQNWLEQLDYINTTMRSIRKVQSDCDFLSLCMRDDTALTREYDGHCFDRIERSDGLYQYNVFIPFLKMAYRITTRELMEDLELRKYKLYLFSNENKYKRKIRLQIHFTGSDAPSKVEQMAHANIHFTGSDAPSLP